MYCKPPIDPKKSPISKELNPNTINKLPNFLWSILFIVFISACISIYIF